MRAPRFARRSSRRLTDADVHNIRYNAMFEVPQDLSAYRKALLVREQLQLSVSYQTVLSVLKNETFVLPKGPQ